MSVLSVVGGSAFVPGQSVEVYSFGRWYPGVVLKYGRSRYLVKYKTGTGTERDKTFAAHKMRATVQMRQAGKPAPTPCGCYAGILLMNGNEVQKCDDCKLFEFDEDAVEGVRAVLMLLSAEYRGRDSSDTVADALERLRKMAGGK